MRRSPTPRPSSCATWNAYANVSPRPYDYRYVIDGYLLPAFGERKLETITADDIDAYKERPLARGTLSNRSVVRHLTVLHAIFRGASRVWKLPLNPASADFV